MDVVTRAAKLVAPGKVELVERKLSVGPDDVLVRTHQASICGTDKMLYRGELPDYAEYPMFFGHEGGGEVVAVGAKVREFHPGDKVMSFGHRDTFADYFLAKPQDLELAPEDLPMSVASLGEPVSCAVFSGLNAGITVGDTVVVLGCGFAGLILVQVAKRAGAYRVLAADVSDAKLAVAKRVGADAVVNLSTAPDPDESFRRLTDGVAPDVVMEAAGSEQTMNLASRIVRHNGKLIFYSWVTRPVTLNIQRWHDDSLEIRNTGLVHHTPEERHAWLPWALRPVRHGLISVEPLLSASYPLERIAEAFAQVAENPDLIKVTITP